MSQAELAEALTALGRTFPTTAVAKAEAVALRDAGVRKLDIDDLMAMAVALNVSPLALLLPDTRRGNDPAEATGFPTGSIAATIWDFATAQASPWTEDVASHKRYATLSTPWWYEVLAAGEPRDVQREAARRTEAAAREAGVDPVTGERKEH